MIPVAVVEDDALYAELLKTVLSQGGYAVSVFETPGRFFDALLDRRPTVAMIDMGLPGMDGKEVIRVLRANPETRPIFVIAMSGDQRAATDAVRGFSAGADEYMVKPIDMDLLLARMQSLLRRGNGQAEHGELLRCAELVVDADARSCRLGGAPVTLTRLEFDLLAHFLRNANRVLTRGGLLDAVWNSDPTINTRTVDKHVETLRRKLGAFGQRLETVIRVGYMLRS